MVTNAQILHSLQLLHQKADILMSQQDDINADVTQITAALSDVATQSTAIVATQQQISDEIAALRNANPAVDLTALDQLAATAGQQAAALDAAVQGLGSLVPAPPAAP